LFKQSQDCLDVAHQQVVQHASSAARAHEAECEQLERLRAARKHATDECHMVGRIETRLAALVEAAEKDGPERKLHSERKHQERKNQDELSEARALAGMRSKQEALETEVVAMESRLAETKLQLEEAHVSIEATLAETCRGHAGALGIQRRLEEATARSEQYYLKLQDLEVLMETKVAAMESNLMNKEKHALIPSPLASRRSVQLIGVQTESSDLMDGQLKAKPRAFGNGAVSTAMGSLNGCGLDTELAPSTLQPEVVAVSTAAQEISQPFLNSGGAAVVRARQERRASTPLSQLSETWPRRERRPSTPRGAKSPGPAEI